MDARAALATASMGEEHSPRGGAGLMVLVHGRHQLRIDRECRFCLEAVVVRLKPTAVAFRP
jgi:hypothetical protein